MFVAIERHEATLDRHQQPACSGERIRDRKINPWPAVDQDQVILRKVRCDHVEEHILAPFPRDSGLDNRFKRKCGWHQIDAGEARRVTHAIEG